MDRLQYNLQKVQEKGSPVAAVLRELGVSFKELQSESPYQQLETLREAFARFADTASKSTAERDLFGRGFADIQAVLAKTSEDVKDLNNNLDESGAILDAGYKEAVKKTKEGIDALSISVQGLSKSAFSELNSAYAGIINASNIFVKSLEDSYKESGFVKQALDSMGYVIKGVSIDIVGLIAGFEVFGETIQLIVEDAIARVEELGKNFLAIGKFVKEGASAIIGQGSFGDAFKELQATLKSNYDQMNKESDAALKKAGESFVRNAQDLLKEYNAIFNNIQSVTEKVSEQGSQNENPEKKPILPNINLAQNQQNEQAVRDAEALASKDIDAAKNVAALREQVLEGSLKDHSINMQEWLNQTEATLRQETETIQAAYAKELETAGLTIAQIDEIRKKQANDLKNITKEQVSAEQKNAQDIQKSYEDAAKNITSTFDSQIKGLLEGTESWSKAMKNVLEDLVLHFINGSIEMTGKWLADSAARAAGAQASAAAQTAAQTQSADAALVSNTAAIGKAILNDAAAAFAGVFAFLAPVLGPLAAGPAAAAMGVVKAVVPSADIGMWSVPQDQLSFVHKNELIMPAAEAGALRSMLTGAANGNAGAGGNVSVNPAVHLNVSALDGASVSSFMQNNSGSFLNAINRAVSSGAHLGLQKLNFT